SEAEDFAEKCNLRVKKQVQKILFERFAENAHHALPQLIASHIVGMEDIKAAVALQLFAKDPVHILLLGDPGTGKTDILRSAADLAPIATFGLGSGTTGAGLVGTYKGFEFSPGLLPQAHQGICAIDELNLLKEESRAGLYNAMEKGFVTYDKGGTHERMNAVVNILATANPKGDRFVETRRLWDVKKQIPFDPALMTRFHLVFLVNKPNTLQFEQIAKSITEKSFDDATEADTQFIKNYIAQAKKLNVRFPKDLEQDIVTFVQLLKKQERTFLVEITPRTVVGFMNMVKASARMNFRPKVEKQDIERVKLIFNRCLYTGLV
ncbi:ATP-binding protein, partial [Candidatus Woesearchaeota archaeon]|nr:ATP-binding protein [Candidatus Woesearchaeota archaeon]